MTSGPPFPVWGIDPSTRRIALAIVLPGGGFVSRTLELGPGTVDAPKLAGARASMVGWFASLADEYDPGWLWVEEPFGADKGSKAKGRRAGVHPASQWMLGVTMEAAYAAAGAVANLIPPASWKSEALGPGHGFAKKAEILRWARERGLDGECGFCEPDGKCKGSPAHDRADALGVATAGAAFVCRELSAARRIVNE